MRPQSDVCSIVVVVYHHRNRLRQRQNYVRKKKNKIWGYPPWAEAGADMAQIKGKGPGLNPPKITKKFLEGAKFCGYPLPLGRGQGQAQQTKVKRPRAQISENNEKTIFFGGVREGW